MCGIAIKTFSCIMKEKVSLEVNKSSQTDGRDSIQKRKAQAGWKYLFEPTFRLNELVLYLQIP
jgi:hypothetical protein